MAQFSLCSVLPFPRVGQPASPGGGFSASIDQGAPTPEGLFPARLVFPRNHTAAALPANGLRPRATEWGYDLLLTTMGEPMTELGDGLLEPVSDAVKGFDHIERLVD